MFRTSPFLRWEKLRCTQQAKAHNKRSITRCFLCINLYAQQIKIRPSLSTDSCTLLAGKSTVFSTSPITIATVHEIHLQLVFFVVIVALYHLFCKLFFLFFNCIFVCKHRLAIFDKFLQRHCLVLIWHTLFIIFRHVILAACSLSPCSIHSTMQSKISLLLL